MKAGVIGGGFASINFEYSYTGTFSTALYELFHKLILDFGIHRGITGAVPGEDILWTWVLEALSIPFIAIIATNQYPLGFHSTDKERVEETKNAAEYIVTLGEGPYNGGKEQLRDRCIVERSDMIIFIWDKKSKGRTVNAMAYAETLDREIFLIDPKELI